MGRGRPRTKHLSGAKAGRFSSRSHATIDRKPIRPLERQRMRPWLVELLDTEGCHQLVWVNRNRNMFRIAWKHAAGQTFDAQADATLFEQWARHTGKFYDGDKADPKRWKANFRCALNSLLDVEEDKAQGVRKGNNAFKVYRFLEEKRARKTPTKKIKDEEEQEAALQVIISRGTKSRPRVPTAMDLDSEGSEGMSSPARSDSNHSDWDDMTSNDLRCHGDEIDRESEQQSGSPLPDFEKLCQSANLFPLGVSPCPGVQLMKESPSPQRLPESYSPQRPADYASSGGSPHHSTDSDEVCSNVSYSNTTCPEDDQKLEEMILVEGAEFWSSFLQEDNSGGCYIQEAPEQIVGGEDCFMGQPGPHVIGPNVIVLNEDNMHNDYMYTSMAEL